MRVAVYLGDIEPSATGGFTFQDEIFRALVQLAPQSAHSFVLVTHRRSSHMYKLDPERFTVVRAPSERRVRMTRAVSMSVGGLEPLLRQCGLRTVLDRRLTRERVDLVWFTSPFFSPTYLPYIYTVWDLQHRVQPWFPELGGGRWHYREHWYSTAFARAFLVITPNRAGVEELQLLYGVPQSRIRVLPHPTPAFACTRGDVRPDVMRKHSLAAPFILYPAGFWPHKNHVGLLRALVDLEKRYRLAPQLVLVGPDRGNLGHVRCTAQKLGVGDRVRILGFVARDELAELYRQATLLGYVSFFGPENLPPLEAFALGCPVVAAKVDGALEQLGDAAVLVDPANPRDIADGIAQVMIDSNLRRRLIENGAHRAGAWTAVDYVRAVMVELDRFASVRSCWGGN